MHKKYNADQFTTNYPQTGPMLESVEEVVLGLTRLLDARVYVALGRGLWDFTAKDVYDYVESLQEDRHNKVGGWRCYRRDGLHLKGSFALAG